MQAFRTLNWLYISDKFVKNRNVFEFFNLNFKSVLHLLEWPAVNTFLPLKSMFLLFRLIWKKLWLFIIFTFDPLVSCKSHFFFVLLPSLILLLLNDYIIMIVALAWINSIRSIHWFAFVFESISLNLSWSSWVSSVNNIWWLRNLRGKQFAWIRLLSALILCGGSNWLGCWNSNSRRIQFSSKIDSII